MNGTSFKSRQGIIACQSAKFYNFISDIRNFEKYVPSDKLSEWKADADSCSFIISPIGSAHIRIREKQPHSLVSFQGKALQNNEFSMEVQISDNGSDKTNVRLELSVDLNPVMKMMVAGPVEQFLEKIISELEKKTDWDK
jgi:carbon monoxide dehydrogenase subunit G